MTLSPVPTGTVLFMTRRRSPPRAAISRTARCTRERSASPDGEGGVSTAMKRIRQRSSRTSVDVVKESRVALSATSFSSPGS